MGSFGLEKSLPGEDQTIGTFISDGHARDLVPQRGPGSDECSPSQCPGLPLPTGNRGCWCREAGGSVVVITVLQRGLTSPNSRCVVSVMLKCTDQ